MLTETRNGVTSYYLYDGQGSVRGLTNSAGTVTDSYSYDAFGNLLTSQGTTVNPYRYDGQYFDSLTGLYDLRARYYDPTTGRFTSADTADVTLENPTELNRYLYASSNPINLSDPSGHDAGDEEAAIYANVDESAIPRAEEFGKDEASVMAANAATELAVNARTLKDVAVIEYERRAEEEGWLVVPPRFIMGRVGIGLTDFLTAFGRTRLAALNNVGINRSHGIDWEDTAKALEKYYEVLRGLARAEGYYILYPGAILRGATARVDHEEKYLVPAVRAFTRAMPPKSYAFLGGSQDTVCGKCLALYFGRPDWGFAARFRYPLDPAREVWLAVSGANPAAGIRDIFGNPV